VQYDVAKLKAAVRAATTAHRAERLAEYTAAAEEYERELAEHAETYGEAWAKAATVIRAKVRKGRPVLKSDLPTDHRGWSIAAYDGRAVKPFAYSPPSAFQVVAAALDIITDETVAPYELSKLGVTPTRLHDVLAYVPTDL
jgi:hypothetical protein